MQQASSSSASLRRENASLKSRNQSLQEEVRSYQQQVSGLSRAMEHLQEVSEFSHTHLRLVTLLLLQELKKTNEHVFELEREREHAQVRLKEADQLQDEVGPALVTLVPCYTAGLLRWDSCFMNIWFWRRFTSSSKCR